MIRLISLTTALILAAEAPVLASGTAEKAPEAPLAWQAPGAVRLTGVALVRFGKRVQVQALTTGPSTVSHGWAGGATNRLYVDVRGAYVTPETVIPLPPPGTVVSRVRAGQFKTHPPVSRIVLEIKPGYAARQSSPKGRPPAVVSYPGARPQRSVPRTAAPKRAAARSATAGRKSFVIAIDPGHGGRDPGARGPRGVQEKRIALDVARRLAEVLRGRGHRVHLSRATDRTLTPAMRTAWLQRTKSDALLSIHCDALASRSYRGGPSTYYHGAHAPSRTLARKVQRQVVARSGARDGGIKSDFSRFGRGFYLLRRARRPAVLVEVGYISNAATERLLATASYRQKLAEGIGAGVLDYLQ